MFLKRSLKIHIIHLTEYEVLRTSSLGVLYEVEVYLSVHWLLNIFSFPICKDLSLAVEAPEKSLRLSCLIMGWSSCVLRSAQVCISLQCHYRSASKKRKANSHKTWTVKPWNSKDRKFKVPFDFDKIHRQSDYHLKLCYVHKRPWKSGLF